MGYDGETAIWIPDFLLESNPTYAYIISLTSNASLARFNVSVSDFIESNAALNASFVASGYANPSTPDEVWQPEWCENVVCHELVNIASTWYVNHFQSVIRNHHLPMKITWWGFSRMAAIVNAMVAAQQPVLFVHYTPDGLVANN
eukprot:UN23918